MSGLSEHEGVRPLLEDPLPVLYLLIGVPSITLGLGLMWMYEGWWQLRQFDRAQAD